MTTALRSRAFFARRPRRVSPETSAARESGALIDEIIDDFSPDIGHVHHWSSITNDLVRRLKARSVPAVVTLHDLFTTCARYFRMPDSRRFCSAEVTRRDCAECVAPDLGGRSVEDVETLVDERWNGLQAELDAAARVLAVSEAQRDLLISLPGFNDPGLVVSPIGLADDIAPRGDIRARDDGRLVIANWGGLDPRKGVHVLLEAVGRMRNNEKVDVHLYGGGTDPAFVAEIEALALGRSVTIHGRYEDDELLDFGSRHDVAVFPFLAFETHGLVVDEALRLGLPVITSDHGAPPERLGDRGITVPREDAAGLADLLDGLIDNPHRIEELRSGTHRARSLDRHLDELLTVYDDTTTT